MGFRQRVRAIVSRLAGAQAPNATDERYDEESQFHIDMQTERFVRDGMSPEDARVPAVFLASFAVIALVLAGVGLYGLLAYAVQQRRHEMGVRMAIGAQRSAMLRLVLGEGVRLAVIGAVVGLLAALALARFIATLLYQVAPSDPAVYTGAAAAVVAVAGLASAIPARRASRVDPATALRSE